MSKTDKAQSTIPAYLFGLSAVSLAVALVPLRYGSLFPSSRALLLCNLMRILSRTIASQSPISIMLQSSALAQMRMISRRIYQMRVSSCFFCSRVGSIVCIDIDVPLHLLPRYQDEDDESALSLLTDWTRLSYFRRATDRCASFLPIR